MGQKDIAQYIQIGEKLKTLRKNAGYSQRDFADLMGIPVSTYSNYENGNRVPDMGKLRKIAETLHAHVSEIVGSESNENPTIIGKKIEFLAEQKGLSIRQLAFKSGVPYSALLPIVKQGTDRVKTQVLQKISLALGVSLGSLIGYPDDLAESSAMTFPNDYVQIDKDGTVTFWCDPDDDIKDKIIKIFDELNDEGKAETLRTVEIIAGNPKYCKPTEE